MNGKYMKNQWFRVEKIGLFLYFKRASEMVLSSFFSGLHQSTFIDNFEKPDWAYECGWCLIERPISTAGLSLIGLLCFGRLL